MGPILPVKFWCKSPPLTPSPHTITQKPLQTQPKQPKALTFYPPAPAGCSNLFRSVQGPQISSNPKTGSTHVPETRSMWSRDVLACAFVCLRCELWKSSLFWLGTGDIGVLTRFNFWNFIGSY